MTHDRRIRNMIRLGVAVALASGLAASPGPSPRVPVAWAQEGWTRVWDSAHVVSMKVPPGWSVDAPRQGGVIAARAPGSMPQASVVVERVPPEETTDTYAAAKAKELVGSLGSAEPLPIGITLDLLGERAHVAAFGWSTGGAKYAIVQVSAASRGVGAVLTLTWDPESRAQEQVIEAVAHTVDIHGAPPSAAGPTRRQGVEGRRDLFAPPPGMASSGPAGARRSATLPPVPSAGSVPLPPPPPGVPVPPAPVGAPQAPGSQQQPPLPALAAVVLGPVPQAVLKSGASYVIVHRGESTPWGTVVAIRASAVVIATPAGEQTIPWSTGGSR